MSGEKRTPIQILQDDMRKTRNQLRDIKKHREQLKKDLQKVRSENKSQVEQLKSTLNQRSQEQKKAVATLKSDMRQTAIRHGEQLAEQRKQMIAGMEAVESRMGAKVENLRDWTRDQLQIQRNEYTRIHQEQQSQLNSLKRDITKINQREDNREQRAREYLQDLEVLISASEKNLPHDKYAPGQLERIRRQLAAAKNQLSEDVPAATIATVQAAHFQLMDLEDDIVQQEASFEMTYRTVADAVGGLLSSVRTNRDLSLEGEEITQEADYWTDGRYTKLENEIEAINTLIRKNKTELSIEQLNEYLDRIDVLSSKQEALIEEAVERIISAQIRAEMSDQVIETLSRQGYVIQDDACGFAESDQRRAYMVKMVNVAGTEIVTVITPEEETHQNTISINTYGDEVNDEKATQTRNQELRTALSEAGLQLGQTECYEKGIEELYDVRSLIEKGGELPSKILRKARGISGEQKSN